MEIRDWVLAGGVVNELEFMLGEAILGRNFKFVPEEKEEQESQEEEEPSLIEDIEWNFSGKLWQMRLHALAIFRADSLVPPSVISNNWNSSGPSGSGYGGVFE